MPRSIQELEQCDLTLVRSICFDFGGTLVPQRELHIAAFMSALHLSLPARRELAAQLIADELTRGSDSFAISERLVQRLRLTAAPGPMTIRKRNIMDQLWMKVMIEPGIVTLLEELVTKVTVTVISQGRIANVAGVLARSSERLAAEVQVVGRHSNDQRVSKVDLLKAALATSGSSPAQSMYVGDTEIDESIARQLGLKYWMAPSR